MLSEQERMYIRILSDNDLYPQAVEFMKSIGRPLPSTQINGLLNVSLGNTYDQLKLFVDHQCARTTWAARDRHIPDFYKKLTNKLKYLEETYVPFVIEFRQEIASQRDEMAIKMELAREFIQHMLAENAYREAMKDFGTASGHNDRNNMKNQGEPHARGEQKRR